MKKIIVILMIISISLSVFSCKRPADSDIGQIINDSNTGDTTEPQKTTEDNFAPSAETEDIKETESEPEASETTQDTVTEEKEQPLGIEVSDEIKKLIDLKDYEYVDENGFVCLKEGYNKSVDKYKYIRATREHILIEKGYVKKKEVGGETRYVATRNKFTIEFDVTEDIKYEIIGYDGEHINTLHQVPESPPGMLEEYERQYLRDGEVVVRGHFAPELGKHVIHYKKADNEDVGRNVNFKITDQYTVIPFTIDKVYGESDLKVGDTIEVRYSRYLAMNIRTKEYTIDDKYDFFDKKTEKQRSFIASIKREKDGTYSTGAIFQNIDLEYNRYDYDTNEYLLQAVAEKYN